MGERVSEELLEELREKVGKGWGEAGEDRRSFLEGLHHLQEGEVEEATAVFRRALRQCESPFVELSRYGLGRCSAVQGKEAMALRMFRELTSEKEPALVRRLAWMEIEALARGRGDQELQEKAREMAGSCGQE